jgi:hypothetical protein
MRFLLAHSWLLAPLALGALYAGCEPLSPTPPGAGSGAITHPAGESCGGLTGEACVKGTYCDYPRQAQCGAADQTGTCQPTPDACDDVYDPVCGCDDRSYGNECEAHAQGVSVAHAGSCKEPGGQDAGAPSDAGPGTRSDAGTSSDAGTRSDAGQPSTRQCGGLAGLSCGRGEFCDYGAACSSVADGTGVCRTLPGACTLIYAPVCGCDGKTYGSECAAHGQGVSVAAQGECKPKPGNDAGSPRVCGGFAALECDPGQFCNYEPPLGQGCDGLVADAAGVCQAMPQGCTLQYDPVCGCDGNTYGNACAAHAAGVSVAGRGECAPKQVSCDRRSVLCRRAEPACPAGQVAAVEGSCWGACVNVEQCSCKEAAACPNADQYTCHLARGVCGPYVR